MKQFIKYAGLTAAGAAAICACGSAKKVEKPNIIVIVADTSAGAT